MPHSILIICSFDGMIKWALLISITNEQVRVHIFTNKTSNNELSDCHDSYFYELWVPQTKRFQTVSLVFNQFPEYNWNKADISLQEHDDLDPMLKAKNLRYVIIPDEVNSGKQLEDFCLKLQKLSAFLSKYCVGGSQVRLKVDMGDFERTLAATSAEESSPSGNLSKTFK